MTLEEEKKHSLLLDSDLIYSSLILLRMVDYNMQCIKMENVGIFKKIVSDATKYYSDTLLIRLKYIQNEGAYMMLKKYLDNDKLIELQAINNTLFDVDLDGLQKIHESLNEITFVKK